MSTSAFAGIDAARARIAAIQAQFSTRAGTTVGSAMSSLSPTALAQGDFQSVLAQLTNANGTINATQTPDMATGTGAPRGADVIAAAEQYLGVPYVYGGTDPTKGLDCSGFVQRAYRDVGVELPRVTYDQVKVGTPVAREDLAPGDLVFSVGDKGMRVNGHVGIYVGNDKYLVAPKTGDVVKVADLPDRITAIRRVLPTEQPSPSVGAISSALAAASARGVGMLGGNV